MTPPRSARCAYISSVHSRNGDERAWRSASAAGDVDLSAAEVELGCTDAGSIHTPLWLFINNLPPPKVDATCRAICSMRTRYWPEGRASGRVKLYARASENVESDQKFITAAKILFTQSGERDG